MGKRFFAALFALLMTVCLLPGVALADDPSAPTAGGNDFFANGTAVTIAAPTTSVGNRTCLVEAAGTSFSNDPSTFPNGAVIYWGSDGAAGGYVYASDTVWVFGGSENTHSTYSTSVTMLSGKVAAICGGSKAGETGGTSVTIRGGNLQGAYGGGCEATSKVKGNTQVVMEGGMISDYTAIQSWGYLCGGGYHGAVEGNASVTMSGGTVEGCVHGGGDTGTVSGSASVTITGGNLWWAYGGGHDSTSKVKGDAMVVMTDGTFGDGMNWGYLYGGGHYGAVEGNASVTMSGGTVGGVGGYVYGGGESGTVSGNADVKITGGTVTRVCGGGENSAATVGTAGGGNTATVTISQPAGKITNITDVYGGGFHSAVNGNSSVTITGGTVSGSVYGGGRDGAVTGSASVAITGGKVEGSVHGGGELTSATVAVTKTVSVSGGPVIGSSSKDMGILLSGITGNKVTITGALTSGAQINLMDPVSATVGTVVAEAATAAHADAQYFTMKNATLKKVDAQIQIGSPPVAITFDTLTADGGLGGSTYTGNEYPGSLTGDTLTVQGPCDNFISVTVDNIILTREVDYTVNCGSTVVTFTPSYLATLKNGPHTVRVQFTDGRYMGTFTTPLASAMAVVPDVPATGSRLTAVAFVWFLCGACCLVARTVVYKRRPYN